MNKKDTKSKTIDKVILALSYIIAFICCVPLSVYIEFKLWYRSYVCDFFGLDFCFVSSGYESGLDFLLELLVFVLFPAWILFTIFYFLVQLLVKLIKS